MESQQEEVFDSPEGWVADHIRGYVQTDGATGHEWHGVNALLLTTRGRKTGKLRRTALYYGPDRTSDGDRYIVVASNGGADSYPAWYLNLAETPEVQVQVQSDKFAATARAATAEEKPRLWALMAGLFPKYESYRQGTQRDIPVVILERV
jgi:deazaflavin-dependent oxidoreductase (nitroreductase family)